MRKLKILIPTALATPLTVAPFITSCSCSNDGDVKNVINNINKVFDQPLTELGTAADETAAINEYAKKVFNSDDAKKNEILFGCFNFTSAKSLDIIVDEPAEGEPETIQVTPDGKSFYDLFKDKKVQMSIGYALNVTKVTNNRFEFTMQGWLTCAYTKDVDLYKSGDFVQFVYDLDTTVYVNLTANEDEGASRYNMSVNYSLTYDDLSTITPAYGFIKMKIAGNYLPDIPITDMDDVNYDPTGYGYNRGYYTKG